MRLQDITINMYYGMNKDFFSLSLPYGSDTLVPPIHQYSCNSLPGPLYTCHPHSCLDSVCHSIVRTYRSFYSLCFRKKRNWKIDNFIFPTSRWRLGIRPRKKTLINFCSKFWSRILKASTTSKLMHKPYMYRSALQKYILRKIQRENWVTFHHYFAYLRIMERGCWSMRNCIVKYDKASKSLTIFHYAGQGENWTSIIDTERAFLPSGCVGQKNLIVVNLSFSFRMIWKKKPWNLFRYFIGF